MIDYRSWVIIVNRCESDVNRWPWRRCAPTARRCNTWPAAWLRRCFKGWRGSGMGENHGKKWWVNGFWMMVYGSKNHHWMVDWSWLMFENVLYHLEFNHDQLCIVPLSGLELNIFQMFGILGRYCSPKKMMWGIAVASQPGWQLWPGSCGWSFQHGCDSTSARTSKILPIWYRHLTKSYLF